MLIFSWLDRADGECSWVATWLGESAVRPSRHVPCRPNPPIAAARTNRTPVLKSEVVIVTGGDEAAVISCPTSSSPAATRVGTGRRGCTRRWSRRRCRARLHSGRVRRSLVRPRRRECWLGPRGPTCDDGWRGACRPRWWPGSIVRTPAIDVSVRHSSLWVTPSSGPNGVIGSAAIASAVSTTGCGVVVVSMLSLCGY